MNASQRIAQAIDDYYLTRGRKPDGVLVTLEQWHHFLSDRTKEAGRPIGPFVDFLYLGAVIEPCIYIHDAVPYERPSRFDRDGFILKAKA